MSNASSGVRDVDVSITIPEENPFSAFRRRPYHPRRKRRKFEPSRTKKESLIRILTKLLNWWPVVLIVLVIGLLIFETLRVFRVSPQIEKPEKIPQVGKEHVHGNLNRLDPTTRIRNGTRQRCLQLLPPEELQSLDLPPIEHHNFPIKKLMYISEETDTGFLIGNHTTPQHHGEVSRFNLFTGYQTLDQRKNSFKVNESAVVHCGFYSKNGGFKISVDDRDFMQSCEVVVSSCTFGGGDDLYQPIGMSEASIRKVCYVTFWDKVTLEAQKSEGHIIDDNHMIGIWRIVIVKELPFMDQRLNGKIPKMLGHRLFPRARFSIWVDSKSQFRRDPLGVLEALLWRTNSVLAISEHGARSSVYDEGKAVVKKHKADPQEVEAQLSQYRLDGFPDDKTFHGKKCLSEASVIVREHTASTNLVMCAWFNEVVRFTSRDQLSFPFVVRQLRVIKSINMFPVCTRKDLVNSMGHLRKARPLGGKW